MVWPDGKENLSGGRTFDQQCGSIWHGRCLWLRLFRILKTATPAKAALAAALTAANLCGPPNTSKSAASAYHSHPSPSRVAAIIQIRIQRGARQRFSRRIRRWSRRSMKPQTWRATVISLVHDLHQGFRICFTNPELNTSNSFRSGTHIPQHAWRFVRILKVCRPFPAEPLFIHPMPCGKQWHQDGEWQ